VFAAQQQQQQLPQQMQQQLPLQQYHHHYQQQLPLAPVYSGQVSNGMITAYAGGAAATAAYHPHFNAGQLQQQLPPASVTAAAAAAAAAAARNPNASGWTDSRKQLESNLAMEQSISCMQLGPDYLTEQQRLVQRLTRLRLDVQLSVADGNCQVGGLSAAVLRCTVFLPCFMRVHC
jgi:hypothetical protein